MSEKPHTVSSFDEDMLHLRSLVIQMGELAHAQVTLAIDALGALDAEVARTIIAHDSQLDLLQVEAELVAVRIFSRHAPLADDLRDVLASLRIVGALERVGDYAKSIAKRTVRMSALDSNGPIDVLADLAQASRALLHKVVAAFVDRDVTQAVEVVLTDEQIDSSYNQAFTALLSAAQQGGAIESITHLQFIAKHFERIADQATNIAEQIQFAENGEILADRRPVDIDED